MGAGVVDRLRAGGRTVIGLHLRRGDYGTFRRRSARWAFVAPTWWYIDWLEQNRHRFPESVLLIASDDLPAVQQFCRRRNCCIVSGQNPAIPQGI